MIKLLLGPISDFHDKLSEVIGNELADVADDFLSDSDED